MGLVYRKADLNDLELLTETRVIVLRAANRLSDDTDMSVVGTASKAYYQQALSEGSHTAFLVFDGEKIIGTGGISYYNIMPTYHEPTGKRAYIMNMYTAPNYRRRGIAARMVRMLLEDAKEHGVSMVGLEATDMGRPLYESCGFEPLVSEMGLVIG